MTAYVIMQNNRVANTVVSDTIPGFGDLAIPISEFDGQTLVEGAKIKIKKAKDKPKKKATYEVDLKDIDVEESRRVKDKPKTE